jgi:hypothetical protein
MPPLMRADRLWWPLLAIVVGSLAVSSAIAQDVAASGDGSAAAAADWEVIAGFLVLLSPVVVIVLLVRALRRRGRRLAALAQARTAAEAALPRAFEQRELDGSVYWVSFTPERIGAQPSSLIFAASTASGFHLYLRRERLDDRLGKWLGVAREFQTGKADFDARWYFDCTIAPELGQWLRDPETLALLEALMRTGFTGLWHGRDGLCVEWAGYKAQEDAWPDDASVAALCALASRMPPGESGPEPPQRDKKIVLAMVLLGIVALSFMGDPYPLVHADALWNWMWVFGLSGAALFAALAGAALRGYARSHHDAAYLAMFGLFACMIGSHGLLTYLNGAYDHSPARVHQTQVIRWVEDQQSNARRSGNTTTTVYRLTVRDWHGGDPVDLRVDRQSFERVRQGVREVEIRTRPGWLGAEWLVGYRVPVPPPEDRSG